LKQEPKGFWRRDIKSLGVAYALFALVFLGFVIQIAGISLTDEYLRPVLKPSRIWGFVEAVGIGITFFAPFISLGALSMVRSGAAQIARSSKRILVWTLAIFAVVLSFAEFIWSCGGHPTWIQGYPY